MDDLIKQVIEKLKKRQNSNAFLSFNNLSSPPGKQLFIDNSCVILKSISIQFAKDLYALKTSNPWVSWVLNGINLGIHFYLQISENIVSFVPRLMVLDWTIDFIINDQTLITASYSNIISRKEIASLPDNAVLIRIHEQKLSDEAIELCNEKKIKIIVRTEKDCIWLK